MNINDVVSKYIALRDEKAALKAEYEEKLAPVVEQMDMIEIALLAKMDEAGADSIKCADGTCYISTRTSASVADRDSFMAHVLENEEWPLLEVRASKAAVEQYIEEHGGQLPPGVDWSAVRVVNFRRKS